MKLLPLILLLFCGCGVSKTKGWYFGPWQTKQPSEQSPLPGDKDWESDWDGYQHKTK